MPPRATCTSFDFDKTVGDVLITRVFFWQDGTADIYVHKGKQDASPRFALGMKTTGEISLTNIDVTFDADQAFLKLYHTAADGRAGAQIRFANGFEGLVKATMGINSASGLVDGPGWKTKIELVCAVNE